MNFHFLVASGLEHVLLFHILGIIIPIDFHIFQRVRYTTNQFSIAHIFRVSVHQWPCFTILTLRPADDWGSLRADHVGHWNLRHPFGPIADIVRVFEQMMDLVTWKGWYHGSLGASNFEMINIWDVGDVLGLPIQWWMEGAIRSVWGIHILHIFLIKSRAKELLGVSQPSNRLCMYIYIIIYIYQYCQTKIISI